MKTCSKAVRLTFEIPLKHPRTLRTGSRSANEINKMNREYRK